MFFNDSHKAVEFRRVLDTAFPSIRGLSTRFSLFLEAMTANIAGAPILTAGPETSNVIAVTVQITDQQGSPLAVAFKPVTWWISDTQGGIPTGTVPNAATDAATAQILKTITAKVFGIAVTDANGQLVISVGETTAKSFWVNVSFGTRTRSLQITFV